MNLTEIIQQDQQLRAELSKLRKEFHEKESELLQKLAGLGRVRQLSADGLDASKILLAEELLADAGRVIEWYNPDHGEDHAAIIDAEQHIANRDQYLLNNYIGVKNYAGFYHQRSDHAYGYGPSHGYMVWRLGFKPQHRRNLDDHEREAVLYWLEALRMGKLRGV